MKRFFRIIALLIIFYETLSAGIDIKKDGAFALVNVDEPKRGDFDFVLFHNNQPIILKCKDGKCFKKIALKDGENLFEWKNSADGLSSNSKVTGGLATLKFYDCQNDRLISTGRVDINNQTFEIKDGKVEIYHSVESATITPHIKDFATRGKIKKSLEIGKSYKICLYPKSYILRVYDCKNSRKIDSGKLMINGQAFDIDRGRVNINRWFGEEVSINPKVKNYTSKGEIRVTPQNGKSDKICLYPMIVDKNKEGRIGDPRFNISWNPSYQDIDIHVITPCGSEIYFKKKKKVCEGYLGELDIDILRGACSKRRRSCQENITFNDGGPRGRYKIIVEKYSGSNSPTDVTLTIINNGEKRVEHFTLIRKKSKAYFEIVH
jgi:hypothetical protein